ncbi:adenylate kinase 8-like [Ostrinia furnacalis]|uniref:adenylate kinase 8-like n=1 Tax=Ostrinia furnacalis TaxID=93504 RepID=UPI00103DC364|nr:adenylate kinase 8-like [Ostrinia furnacalis]
MTETDATKRPLTMPEKFIPYLEKYRVYKVFKDMTEDLIVHLPKDHLIHMKVFLGRHLHSTGDIERIMMLVSPNLKIDIKSLTKELIRDMGFIVITRRCVMDRYERHDDYIPGCISPVLMSEVTKQLACKEPVAQAGWLMFDHPCTVREARCLQQDGIFPTVTLVLTPTPPQAPPADDPLTPSRNFFQQDFEGLKFAYKATLKVSYRLYSKLETLRGRITGLPEVFFVDFGGAAFALDGVGEGEPEIGEPKPNSSSEDMFVW